MTSQKVTLQQPVVTLLIAVYWER